MKSSSVQRYLCQKHRTKPLQTVGKDYSTLETTPMAALKRSTGKQQHGSASRLSEIPMAAIRFSITAGGQTAICRRLFSATRSILGSTIDQRLGAGKDRRFWVNGQMFGGMVKGDFTTAMSLFLGKNPWHTHGIPPPRAGLKEFSKDPSKTMIVVDPVLTERENGRYPLASEARHRRLMLAQWWVCWFKTSATLRPGSMNTHWG